MAFLGHGGRPRPIGGTPRCAGSKEDREDLGAKMSRVSIEGRATRPRERTRFLLAMLVFFLFCAVLGSSIQTSYLALTSLARLLYVTC
jgi:hypothetical protein